MSNPKRRKLRNLLINKSFQGRVVVLVLFFGFLSFVLNGVLFYLYVQENYTLIFSSVEAPPFLIESMFRDLRNFGLILVAISVLVTLVIGFYLLVLTHRAAGAAYHMHRVVNEIKAGHTDARVHLREKDEFKDLAQSFNDLIDGMQQKNSS